MHTQNNQPRDHQVLLSRNCTVHLGFRSTFAALATCCAVRFVPGRVRDG